MIISASNREVEARNLRQLCAELLAVWPDISNALSGFKDHSLHLLLLDEVLVLELSNFSSQLKLKPRIIENHRLIVAVPNGLWFRGMGIKKEGEKRQNSKETNVIWKQWFCARSQRPISGCT